VNSGLAARVGTDTRGTPVEVLAFEQGWRASTFSEWDFPDHVLGAWDDLAREHGDVGVLLESGWFEQWWSAMGQGGRLFVVVIEHHGAITGIFPCWVTPVGRLEALADDFHYDLLVSRNEVRETLAHFVNVVQAARRTLPACLQNFSGSSRFRKALEDQLRSSRTPVGVYSRPSAPYVDTRTTSWEAYADGLHSKLKNNLKKGRRRASRDGELSFEIIRQPQSLDAILKELFEVESRGWKGAQGTAIKCVPEKEAFYRGIAEWAMLTKHLYIFALRLNDQMIAFDFCVLGGRTMFALRTGYDQTLAARFSPGNLMRYQVMEYVFGSGLDRYDFLGPAYPWKLEWTTSVNTCVSLEIYPPTVAGWCGYFRKYGWKKPLKRSKRLVELAKSLRQRTAKSG
jgi:CelD/BcsL family acetyltransferase involved in cellulose biosynthesis